MRMMPEEKKCMSVLDLRVAADQNDFELLLHQTSTNLLIMIIHLQDVDNFTKSGKLSFNDAKMILPQDHQKLWLENIFKSTRRLHCLVCYSIIFHSRNLTAVTLACEVANSTKDC